MPDARVQAAIEHWAPRFVQAGVDYNDFLTTTARVETLGRVARRRGATPASDARGARAQAEAARAPAQPPGRRGARGGRASTSPSSSGWSTRPEPDAGDRAIAALAQAHELLDTGMERIEVPFDGGRIVANLRRPARARTGRRSSC